MKGKQRCVLFLTTKVGASSHADELSGALLPQQLEESLCAWWGFLTTGDYMELGVTWGRHLGRTVTPIPEWPNLRFVKTSTVVFGNVLQSVFGQY